MYSVYLLKFTVEKKRITNEKKEKHFQFNYLFF